MTELLFRTDPYLKTAPARVLQTDAGGVVLDASLFYPTGGGQPGDSGRLDWPGGSLQIAEAVKGGGDSILLRPADPAAALPDPGTQVAQHLDWDRRHLHMRVHTALHLLSVVIPLPVTGGQIGPGKGRLDFDMPEAPGDKLALETALNALIARDLQVQEHWITDAELDARPEMVKTMAVKPPTGQGRVRLIAIGEGGDRIDLQPCGGTHVARTGEIGPVSVGKIEKKGRQNRRVTILLQG